MSISPLNRAIQAEPTFCELVSTCQLAQLAKRIVLSVVHVFVAIVCGILNMTTWACRAITQCLTSKASETPPPRAFEGLAPSPVLAEGEHVANREKALARMKEFSNTLEVALNNVKANPEQSLRRLAEMETGTPSGTLANAPRGVLQRLKDTPLTVPEYGYWGESTRKTIPNAARANIWPEGIRAADKLVELQKNPEDAYLRLAQMDALAHLFQIDDQVFQFDIDVALNSYSKTHPSSALQQWYDYASFQGGDRQLKQDYQQALRTYATPGFKSQEKTVAVLLSNIHDLLLTQSANVTQGSTEEAELKGMVKTFITQLVDANKGCVDQMNSQLEILTLDFLAYGQSDKTPLEKLKFRAGLALCQYRSKLIAAFTRELYPDEVHAADLEREVKKNLAEILGLNGAAFREGAAFAVVHNIAGKAEKIGEAVMTIHNPTRFLLEETQAANNSVPATFYLRQHLTMMMQQYFDMDNLSTDDPFVQELSKIKGDGTDQADQGGPLTFEATLFYLEAAGIFVRN